MYILVQPAPVFTRKVRVRLVPELHAALLARARRGDGARRFCEGFESMRVEGASPGVELYCLYPFERRGRGALALRVFVGAGARTGSGLAHFEAAVHAAARRGRGEASPAEPGRGARGAVLAFRRGRVRAFANVFFVTLGFVKSVP